MASLSECIELALNANRISADEADALRRKVSAHEEFLRLHKGMSPELAKREAERLAIDSQRSEIALRKRQKALQIIALDKAVTRALSHPDGAATGVAAILARDTTGKAKHTNVDVRAQAVEARTHQIMAEGLDKMRTKYLGFWQDRRLIKTAVREIFGESTGNADAKAIAKAWNEVAEELRQRFNRAGGAIAKREDWGMPQNHDAGKILRASKEEWVNFTRERIDPTKMTGPDGTPLTRAELDELLSKTYDRVSTDGLVDLIPGSAGGKKLANRFQDRRVLAFRDADAWMEYQEKFGSPDIFTVMTDHMSRMSHDIAMLEVMGPSPETTFRYLSDVARKNGANPINMQYLEALRNTVFGVVDKNKSAYLADAMAAARNWVTAARLGSATLSAVADIGFLQKTSTWNGLPAMKVATRMLKNLNPNNSADRIAAVKMGLGADAWVTRALAANRFTDVTGAGLSAKAADFTMRASGLSAWTDAGKKAFGMEMMGMLGDNANTRFADLSAPVRRTFDAYGINEADWNLMRSTPAFEHEGARFLSIENFMKREDIDIARRQELATKYQEMIITETMFAVPEPDARIRAITTGGRSRGTISGEIIRGVGQFKSFPLTVITTHLLRGLNQEGLSKAAYLSQIMIATTVMGALAVQLKEISRGRDPRDMNDPKFWAAAFTQGGGAGIYGDFLFADANRFGGGLMQTLAGPQVDLAEDIYKLTVGNIQQAVRAEDMDLTADVIRFAKDYTPGNSLWYARLALEREMFDQLELMAEPLETRRKFRRFERGRMRDYQQRYWWRPGAREPARAPALAAAVDE